jgi:hypothetical protein
MTELGGSPQARGCPAAAIVGERQCRLARPPELVSEILRTPLLFSGHVPRPMLRGRPGACRGTLPGRRHASVLSVNLRFLASLCMCGAATSPALLLPSMRTAVADPTRARQQNPARCR